MFCCNNTGLQNFEYNPNFQIDLCSSIIDEDSTNCKVVIDFHVIFRIFLNCVTSQSDRIYNTSYKIFVLEFDIEATSFSKQTKLS